MYFLRLSAGGGNHFSILILLNVILFGSGCAEINLRPPLTLNEYELLDHDMPYELRICKGTGMLKYLGVEHSNLIASPTINFILERYKKTSPQIIYVEGPVFAPKATLNESVSAYGEPGALLFLAASDKVHVKSLDLRPSDEMAQVIGKFGQDWATAFYGLRLVAQESTENPMVSIKEFLEHKVLPWLSKNMALIPGLKSEQEFIKIVNSVLPEVGDLSQISVDWFDPISSHKDRKTNQIARFLVETRDKRMVRLLGEEINEGKRIFAAAGFSHVVMQELAIASYVGCPNSKYDAKRKISPSIYQCDIACKVE